MYMIIVHILKSNPYGKINKKLKRKHVGIDCIHKK